MLLPGDSRRALAWRLRQEHTGGHEKQVQDEVHQNQILKEQILKELRTQKLYTQYHVNPLRKVHPVTGKLVSWHSNLEEPADGNYCEDEKIKDHYKSSRKNLRCFMFETLCEHKEDFQDGETCTWIPNVNLIMKISSDALRRYKEYRKASAYGSSLQASGGTQSVRKQYQCNTCLKGLSSSNSLQGHKRIHHPENPMNVITVTLKCMKKVVVGRSPMMVNNVVKLL